MWLGEEQEQKSMGNMLELADRLRELKGQKKQLQEAEKQVNAELEKTEQELADLMVQEETQNFTRAGQLFYLQTKTMASPIAERKQEVYAWLKEHGYGDLVYETVNSNSFSAFVKELMEEEGELPEDLAELVNIHEKTTVGMRKASK